MREHDVSASFKCNRALFLDRVVVINVNHGYLHRPENFNFMYGIFAVAHAVHVQHYKLGIITKQAEIARGYCKEQQLHELTHWMCNEFLMQSATVTKVYFFCHTIPHTVSANTEKTIFRANPTLE